MIIKRTGKPYNGFIHELIEFHAGHSNTATSSVVGSPRRTQNVFRAKIEKKNPKINNDFV